LKIKQSLVKLIPYLGIGIITIFSIAKLVADGTHITKLVASTAMLLIMIGIFSFYFLMYDEVQLEKKRYQLMLWLFVFIGYLPSLLLIDVNPYLLPLLLTAALITSMIHVRLGFMMNFVMLTILIISSRMDIETYLVYVIVGSYLCLSIPYAKNRQQVAYVAVSNMLIFMLVTLVGHLMSYGTLVDFNYLNLVYSGLNGGLVVIVAVGSEPVWEALFKITSNERLIELSNSNEPLLKRLILEAPGTYHHSMIVSNLAEKAAIEVNCNYHLARVGALYHDIGKINRPLYFTENQDSVNVHDQLSPDASAKYIIDHVLEGLELADEYKLPEDIKAIIKQHQGDSVVSFFYNKAIDHSDGFDIDVKDYMYPGPKPQTKEAAIVMLADCVDAATKSLGENKRNLDAISDIIDKVIGSVFSNKQLDEAPLTFNELPLIKKAFLTVYNGMYHERIKYDRELKSIDNI